MSNLYVFLHVGEDVEQPLLLVRSLRLLTPRAEIVQCSDVSTPVVPGVDRLFRLAESADNLMTFRLACFAALAESRPALYLDTDMLCVRPVDAAMLLERHDVAVCAREFDRAEFINTRIRGLDLHEYQGQTFGAVYPFVACTTAVSGGSFWAECLANLRGLPAKFHQWYGDQEAIRNIVNSGRYRVRALPESVYGCLPERMDRALASPRLLHFKGPARKPLMVEHARHRGLL